MNTHPSADVLDADGFSTEPDEDHVCITHDHSWASVARVDRPRPCTRRGVHYAACEDPDECRGCVPRTATHGLLCSVCWNRAVDALSRVEEMIVHLRSIDSAGQALGERVATSKQIRLPLHESWMAADDLLDALGARPIPSTAPIDDVFGIASAAVSRWGNLEDRIATGEGATRAVVLAKRMQAALRRWPGSEAHYRPVPHLLCPNCSQRTLHRRAPLEYGDELLVECDGSPLMYPVGDGYDYCEWRMDWDEFATTYGPIFEHIVREEDRAAGRRLTARITARKRPTSDECDTGRHDDCRNLECSCDCHERTYSLWSPKQSVNRLRELAAADGRKAHV